MEDKEIVLRRAKNAVISRDFNLAIRLYKSLLQDDVKNLQYLNSLGNLYMKANDDSKALPYFQQILTFYPNNFEAMNACGGIFRRMGKYSESIEILQKALDTKINPAQVHYNLGFTYKLMGNNQDAIECFENVIALNPTDVLAYNHLGSIYASLKDNQKAVATYKRGLQVDPNHPILQFNLAKCFQEMHDDGSAIQAYETALKARPGWQDAVIAYAELLLDHRKTKAAGELVQSAIGLHPQDGGLYVQMGRILMQQNNYEKAQSSFEIANRLASGNADTLRELAISFEKQGKSIESVAAIQEARKISPEDVEIKKTAADLMLSANKISEAASIIKDLGSTEKTDCEVLDLAGQYSILTGKDESAEAYAKKIKALNPEYIAHLYSYATRYMQQEKFSMAKQKIQAYIDEKMKDVPAWILLGQIDEALGNPTDALDDYSTAVAFDPNNFLAGKLAQSLGEKIDSEINSMEEARAASSELAGAEEISLDEFGLGLDEDAEIQPDEEIQDPSNSDGLTEENDADILEMDDVTSLFEDGSDDGISAPAEPEEESEEEVEEEQEELEEQDEELIPEPFEENPEIDIDSNGETPDFDGWGTIDPELEGNSESETEEAEETSDPEESDSLETDNEEPEVAEENVQEPLVEEEVEIPSVVSVDEELPEKMDLDAILGDEEEPAVNAIPVDSVPMYQKAAEANAQTAANLAKAASEIARQISASAEMQKVSEAVEKAAASAKEASDAAEKSWAAAQKSADLMQSAEEAEKMLDQKTTEALEEIERAKRAEASYDKLVDQVSGMLPRLSTLLENPEEIEKFKKEIELFKRLRELGELLPFEQRAKFLAGRVRLLLDYIIARLSGKPGLLKAATEIRKQENLPEIQCSQVSGSPSDIVNTIRHMESLTFYLQDQDLAKALMVAAEEVIEKL